MEGVKIGIKKFKEEVDRALAIKHSIKEEAKEIREAIENFVKEVFNEELRESLWEWKEGEHMKYNEKALIKLKIYDDAVRKALYKSKDREYDFKIEKKENLENLEVEIVLEILLNEIRIATVKAEIYL